MSRGGHPARWPALYAIDKAMLAVNNNEGCGQILCGYCMRIILLRTQDVAWEVVTGHEGGFCLCTYSNMHSYKGHITVHIEFANSMIVIGDTRLQCVLKPVLKNWVATVTLIHDSLIMQSVLASQNLGLRPGYK